MLEQEDAFKSIYYDQRGCSYFIFFKKAHALGYLRNLKERVVQEHFVRFACVKHIAEVA